MAKLFFVLYIRFYKFLYISIQGKYDLLIVDTQYAFRQTRSIKQNFDVVPPNRVPAAKILYDMYIQQNKELSSPMLNDNISLAKFCLGWIYCCACDTSFKFASYYHETLLNNHTPCQSCRELSHYKWTRPFLYIFFYPKQLYIFFCSMSFLCLYISTRRLYSHHWRWLWS